MQKIYKGYQVWEGSKEAKAGVWCIIETQRRTDGARFLGCRENGIEKLMEYVPGSERLSHEEFQEACEIAWVQKMITGDENVMIPQHNCTSFAKLPAKTKQVR